MGTRSLTVFEESWETKKGKEKKEEICRMYRQYDGYPSGHGKDLAEFLSGFLMVNGYGKEKHKIANGMGCLTAQVIANFKNGVGNIYVYPSKTKDCWEQYTYFISGKEGKEPIIKCVENHSEEYGGNKILFDGSASSFLNWIKDQEVQP